MEIDLEAGIKKLDELKSKRGSADTDFRVWADDLRAIFIAMRLKEETMSAQKQGLYLSVETAHNRLCIVERKINKIMQQLAAMRPTEKDDLIKNPGNGRRESEYKHLCSYGKYDKDAEIALLKPTEPCGGFDSKDWCGVVIDRTTEGLRICTNKKPCKEHTIQGQDACAIPEGLYECLCCHCHKHFYGRKREVTCPECAKDAEIQRFKEMLGMLQKAEMDRHSADIDEINRLKARLAEAEKLLTEASIYDFNHPYVATKEMQGWICRVRRALGKERK